MGGGKDRKPIYGLALLVPNTGHNESSDSSQKRTKRDCVQDSEERLHD